MCLNTTVKILEINDKILYMEKGGTTYILYQYGNEYNQENRYAAPFRHYV